MGGKGDDLAETIALSLSWRCISRWLSDMNESSGPGCEGKKADPGDTDRPGGGRAPGLKDTQERGTGGGTLVVCRFYGI